MLNSGYPKYIIKRVWNKENKKSFLLVFSKESEATLRQISYHQKNNNILYDLLNLRLFLFISTLFNTFPRQSLLYR